MLFLDFLGIRKPPTDPTDRPTDKKEGHEIDSFKGNLSKSVKFRNPQNR